MQSLAALAKLTRPATHGRSALCSPALHSRRAHVTLRRAPGLARRQRYGTCRQQTLRCADDGDPNCLRRGAVRQRDDLAAALVLHQHAFFGKDLRVDFCRGTGLQDPHGEVEEHRHAAKHIPHVVSIGREDDGGADHREKARQATADHEGGLHGLIVLPSNEVPLLLCEPSVSQFPRDDNGLIVCAAGLRQLHLGHCRKDNAYAGNGRRRMWAKGAQGCVRV
mmetsp:Transcript_82433/g.251902  ORF Transcript_82433/g.251902 Transcript_82433/m.251902 type:complete len:222 (-) Transcript_82433:32-697(-)